MMYVITFYSDGSANIHTHDNGVCQHDNVVDEWADAEAAKDDIVAKWSPVGQPLMAQGITGPIIQSEVIPNT